MGLNRTRSIPNSTEVWWEMAENRAGFRVTPLCKLKEKIHFRMLITEENEI